MATGGERRVAFVFTSPKGPVTVSARVRDAPPLLPEEAGRQRRAAAALLGREAAGGGLPEPVLAASLFVEERRYDAWRSVEVLEGLRAEIPGTIPLAAWALHVRGPGLEYESAYLGPPFPVDDLEALAPAEAADRLAVMDAGAYDGRETELGPYRRRAVRHSAEKAAQYELALSIWFHRFTGSPGPVRDAEAPLLAALATSPRDHACHGLLGEVRLQDGRPVEAARAFEEAARLHPRHPRFHYCLSVALGEAGDAAGAARALEEAKERAGPRLKSRFTSGSNPLQDYRTALLGEVVRVRKAREGLVTPSGREQAEAARAENQADPTRVPEDLRAVLPLALKWGVGDDGAREYFVRRATRSEKAELGAALSAHGPRIAAWLDSLGPEGIVTPEAGSFLFLLEACAELGLDRPPRAPRKA
jgi:hypothetical protein